MNPYEAVFKALMIVGGSICTGIGIVWLIGYIKKLIQ